MNRLLNKIAIFLLFSIILSSCSQPNESRPFFLKHLIDPGIQLPQWSNAKGSIESSLQGADTGLNPQEQYLACIDGTWRRSLVISRESSVNTELRADGRGILQFWSWYSPIEPEAKELDLTLIFELVNKSEFTRTVKLPSGSGWQKVDIAVDYSDSLKNITWKMEGSGSKTKVLIGSPVFFSEGPLDQPNVFVIVLDSLRARDLGAYGSPEANSPFLDRFAQNNLTYTHAVSSSSWTLPAVKNLMSGQYSNRFSREGENLYSIRQPFPLIQQFLSAHNWFSMAVTANHLVMVDKGFEKGFAVFDSQPSTLWRHGSSEKFLLRTLDLLRENHDKPLCMYLHLMDPHDPYTPVSLYEKFANPPPEHLIREFLHSRETGQLNFMNKGNENALFKIEKRYLHDSYRGEIRQIDVVLNLLYRELTRLGIVENSIIVILADHGEEFGEHGYYQHGRTLFEEAVHVPFILKPGDEKFKGHICSGNISTLDVPSTICDLLGMSFPYQSQESRSVYPPDPNAFNQRHIFSLLHHQVKNRKSSQSLWRSLHQGERKIIYNSLEGYTCIDLERYPSEKKGYQFDSSQGLPSSLGHWSDMVEILEQAMLNELSQKEESEPKNNQLKQKLRQLGYIQ